MSSSRRIDYRDNSNKNTVKYQPNSSQSLSRFGPNNSNPKREDKGKGIAGESSRSIQQTQCFKCRGYGHVSAQCPSK